MIFPQVLRCVFAACVCVCVVCVWLCVVCVTVASGLAGERPERLDEWITDIELIEEFPFQLCTDIRSTLRSLS